LPRSDSGPGGGAQCKRYGTAAFKRRLAGDRRGAAWSQSGQTDGRCDKFREGPSPQEALLPAGVFIQRERQTMRGKRPACAVRTQCYKTCLISMLDDIPVENNGFGAADERLV